MQPGLRPRELDRSARRDLNAMLRRVELVCAGVDCFIPAEHFTRNEMVDRALAAVEGAIELAADLGRAPVALSLPRRATDSSESTDDSSKVQSDGFVMQSIAAMADRFGVEVADHTVPLLLPPPEGIGVGVDPAAWLARNENPADVVTRSGASVVSARLVDLLTTGLRGPIGDRQEGRLDATGYRVALSVVGYARPVVVDARQWLHPWEGLERTRLRWERDAIG